MTNYEKPLTNNGEAKYTEKPLYKMITEVEMKPWQGYEDLVDGPWQLGLPDEVVNLPSQDLARMADQLGEIAGDSVIRCDIYQGVDSGDVIYTTAELTGGDTVEELIDRVMYVGQDFDAIYCLDGNLDCVSMDRVSLYDPNILLNDQYTQSAEDISEEEWLEAHVADVEMTLKPVFEDVSEEEFQAFLNEQNQVLDDLKHQSFTFTADQEARSTLAQEVEAKEAKISKAKARYEAWAENNKQLA